MDNTKFIRLAEQTINLIATKIELEDEEGVIEVDFEGDVLFLATSAGIFVINKHLATQEIWLSSPISGPHHFYQLNGRWKSKSHKDLILILEQELKINFNS